MNTHMNTHMHTHGATGSYHVSISAEFSAAHFIPGYPGNCARPHGHNWVVEVEMVSTQLDNIGMAMDFRDLKKETKALLAQLDHRMINEVPPFTTLPPTAENLAAWVFGELRARFVPPLSLQAVTVWETRECKVRYTEPASPALS